MSDDRVVVNSQVDLFLLALLELLLICDRTAAHCFQSPWCCQVRVTKPHEEDLVITQFVA